MRDYLLPGALATIVTFLVTPFIIILAKRYKLVDDPKTRYHPAHTHKGTIPRAGGLAVFVGIVTASLLFLPANKLLAGILLGASILIAMGLIDDRKDINPYMRFFTNALAAGVVVAAGAGIPYITNPLTGGLLHLDSWRVTIEFIGMHSILVWADLLAFLWIIWTINIVGWSGGVDGQLPGFVAIGSTVLGILSLRYSLTDPTQLWITVFAFIVAGAYAGFTPWNFYPQKIMPGYGGKTLAGLLLALLGILSYGKLGTALLVLGIPMADAGYTLIRRLTSKKSPVVADAGHLHHKLLQLGWGRRRIALFYWGVSAILGIVSLTYTSKEKFFVFAIVFVGVGMLLLWINFFSQLEKPYDPDSG